MSGFLFPEHADKSDNDKGYGEYLSHIKGQGSFESLLYLFGVFDEEAEGEDISQAEAEVPACTNSLWHLLM